jgi:homotetrameric cytidine deaminase
LPPAAVSHRNVELKARDAEPAATLAAALALGATDHGVLRQRDTYFAARSGRLKLREQEPGGAQLVAYERADAARARQSTYRLVDVPDPAALSAALDAALGVVVVVDKERRLLIDDGVRIHLDDVCGLGAWIELEAVAAPGSDLTTEHAKVARLRGTLGLAEDRVVAEGYAALLLARGGTTERLVALARAVRERAHAPYSRFRVGAALRDERGGLHAGANVESASYPEGQCAETSALGALVASGGRQIEEIAVLADTELVTPCGGCRQRLAELAGPAVPVHLCGPEGIRRTTTLGELLPLGFAAGSLPA